MGSQALPPVTPCPSTHPKALSRYHLGVGQLGRPRPPPGPAPSSGPAPPRPARSRLNPESGRRALSLACTFTLWCGSRGRPLGGGSEQQAILETNGLGRLIAVGERITR